MLVINFNLSQSFNYMPYLFCKTRFKSEINCFCIRAQVRLLATVGVVMFRNRPRLLHEVFTIFLGRNEEPLSVLALRLNFARCHLSTQEVSISGPTLYNGPRSGYCPPQNHYVPRHKNNRYIHSYIFFVTEEPFMHLTVSCRFL
jgi:hypothetical protein